MRRVFSLQSQVVHYVPLERAGPKSLELQFKQWAVTLMDVLATGKPIVGCEIVTALGPGAQWLPLMVP